MMKLNSLDYRIWILVIITFFDKWMSQFLISALDPMTPFQSFHKDLDYYWPNFMELIKDTKDINVNSWNECLDSECNQTKLTIRLFTHRWTFKWAIPFKTLIEVYINLHMVRQNLFLKTGPLRPWSMYKKINECLYQQYNPSFGVESFVQNGFKYSEIAAIAFQCPDKLFQKDENWTYYWKFFYVYLRNPNPWNPDFILKFREEWFKDDVTRVVDVDEIVKQKSEQRDDMAFISPPLTFANQLHPIVNMLKSKFRVPIGEHLDIWRDPKIANSFDKLINSDERFGQILQPNLYPPLSERRKFVPYFKLAVYYHPGKHMFITEKRIFAAIYIADLLLRRLGIRLLVTSISDLDTWKEPTIADKATGDLFMFDENIPIANAQVVFCKLGDNKIWDPYKLRPNQSLTWNLGTKRAVIVIGPEPTEAMKLLTDIKRLIFGPIVYNGLEPVAGAAPFMPRYLREFAIFNFHWDPFLYHAVENLNSYQRMHLKPPSLNKKEVYKWKEEYPICGDGRLDPSEKCECHTGGCFYFNRDQNRTLPHSCCDPYSCSLKKKATCGTGACCNFKTCHIHQDVRYCNNPNRINCELSSMCTVTSEHCPLNQYLPDGETCGATKSSVCWERFCQDTAHSTCERILFKRKTQNDEMLKNTQGDLHHNCGIDPQSKKLIPCMTQNVECGTLHCTSVKTDASKRLAGATDTSVTTVAFVDYFDKAAHMQTLLSPDGTLCVNQSICLKGVCKPLQKPVSKFACPQNCNNAGYCSSEGKCHCYHLKGEDYSDVHRCIIRSNVTVVTKNYDTESLPEITPSGSDGQKSTDMLYTQTMEVTVNTESFYMANPQALEKEDNYDFYIMIVVFLGTLLTVFFLVWLLTQNSNSYRFAKMRTRRTVLPVSPKLHVPKVTKTKSPVPKVTTTKSPVSKGIKSNLSPSKSSSSKIKTSKIVSKSTVSKTKDGELISSM